MITDKDLIINQIISVSRTKYGGKRFLLLRHKKCSGPFASLSVTLKLPHSKNNKRQDLKSFLCLALYLN